MRLAAFLGRLAADRHGGVAVMLALLLPVVVGIASLGVETGLWFSERRVLQNAADAAALSGAFELTAGRKGTVLASALADGRKNAGDATFSIRNPPTTGKFIGSSSAVEAVVTRPQNLLLAALFMGDMTVTARAVARVGSTGDPCILALDNAQSSAVKITGSAGVVLKDCGMKANSSSAKALTISGSASLTAKFAEMVGGYDLTGSSKLTADSILTNSTASEDPFQAVPNPPVGNCTQNGYKLTGTATATLSPGVYCNGIEISGSSRATLSPGVYVVNGGNFKISGSTQISGTGVTIFLTGSGGNYATADISGSTTVNLTAANAGSYAGMLFFQDRNAPVGGDNKFTGSSSMSLGGALYFPNQQVSFHGSTSNSGGCTRIVADTVVFTGSSTLGNACASLGLSMAGATPPRLVE